jgi:hypothetical protein
MKKYFCSLALFVCSFGAFAQFEGTVVFGITMPDMGGENSAMMAAMMPTECTLEVGKVKTRMEMKMGMGMQTVTIVDKKTKEIVSLMDMMGNKMAIVMNENDVSKEKSAVKLKTLDAGDKLEIAGYSCKHAIYEDKSGTKLDVYYTDAFGKESYSGSASNPYKEIEGLMLKHTIVQKGMKMTMTAKSVSKGKIDDTKFVIPEGYKRMTQEEMKKAFGG